MRDPALDLVRSIALARVVLWHAFAAPWMTWFAAMPLLFFVAGALLAASQEVSRPLTVLVRRCRRLLPCLWAYGAFVAVAGAVRSGSLSGDGGWSFAALRVAVSWILPVTDPVGSAWHGGWLSTHLWYLRAYLWLLLLVPVLGVLARRLRLSLPLLAVAIVAVEVPSLGRLLGPEGNWWHPAIGDAVTYGTFAVLGMAFQRNGYRLPASPRRLLAGAVGAAGATAVYAAWTGLPGGEVNNSYPAVALAGTAWLLLAGAGEAPLRAFAVRAPVRRMTAAVTRRAVTVYLWHPAAIAAAYVAVGRSPLPDPATGAAVVPVSAALIVVAVLAVGWVEDLAARQSLRRERPPRVRQAPVLVPGLATAAVALTLVAAPIFPDPAQASGSRSAGSATAPVRPPSYREALSDAAFPQARAPLAARVRLRGTMPERALQAALDQWMAHNQGFDSVAVGLTVGGQTWAGDAARPQAAAITRAEDRYGIVSVTKTFTTALVLREAARGRIQLDRPVPRLPGVRPQPLPAAITPRHLLQHTSGLLDYRSAPGYDPEQTLTPRDAVNLALGAPLLSAPGERVNYGNVNFLYLGLLVEHATGRPYADLVADLIRPLSLRHTAVDTTDGAGWTGFSSGGVTSTVADLSRWGDALFSPGTVVNRDAYRALTTIDDYNLALAAWPLCPCSTATDGRKQAVAFGQYTGHGGLYHFPEGFTLAVHLEPPVEGTDGLVSSLGEALAEVLRARTGR